MITESQFALAQEGGRVSLWCTPEGVDDKGRQKFYVINGAWSGVFDGTSIQVDATGRSYPATLVWQGRARFALSQYNEAIEWITQEIENGASGTDTAVHGVLSGLREEHLRHGSLSGAEEGQEIEEDQGGELGRLVDEPVGDYVNTPEYLEMRLRIRLTGTATPSPEYWSEALQKLLEDLDRDEVAF